MPRVIMGAAVAAIAMFVIGFIFFGLGLQNFAIRSVGDLNAAEKYYRMGSELGLKEPEPKTHSRNLWDFRLHHALGRLAARRENKVEAIRQIALARRALDGADSATKAQQERFFPYLVGFGALTCGVLLLIGALLGNRSQPEGGEDVDLGVRDNLRPVLVIAVALTAGAVLMKPAGFVLAATLVFTGVALAFGSRRQLRDVAIGLLLSLGAYLAFTRLLSLTLPAGVLPW